jgi:predicted nucleotidyltransferase
MQPTPYLAVNALLEEVLSLQQKILGKKLVGLYVYGSLVTGDFDLNVSDIDVLCAVSSDIDPSEFDKLHRMHTDLAKTHPVWNDRIEVQYVSLHCLKTFKTQRSTIAAICPGEPFHLLEAGKDWLVNWYVVQEKGIVLFGPAPEEIISRITKEEFIQVVKGHALSWQERVKHLSKRRGSQAYAIITVCRAYSTITHGEQVSKRQAAQWVQTQFPEWSSLIQQAQIWREEQWENQTEEEKMYHETVRFVHEIVKKALISQERSI